MSDARALHAHARELDRWADGGRPVIVDGWPERRASADDRVLRLVELWRWVGASFESLRAVEPHAIAVRRSSDVDLRAAGFAAPASLTFRYEYGARVIAVERYRYTSRWIVDASTAFRRALRARCSGEAGPPWPLWSRYGAPHLSMLLLPVEAERDGVRRELLAACGPAWQLHRDATIARLVDGLAAWIGGGGDVPAELLALADHTQAICGRGPDDLRRALRGRPAASSGKPQSRALLRRTEAVLVDARRSLPKSALRGPRASAHAIAARLVGMAEARVRAATAIGR